MAVNQDSIIKNDIRAREYLQEFFVENGIDPIIIIWNEREFAYLESDSYEEVGKIINAHGSEVCDISDISDIERALYQEYLYFCKEAEEDIQRETQVGFDYPMEGCTSSYIVTWEGKDGFYGCTCSINTNGLYSESDDVGPFESIDEVKAQFDA